MNCKAVFFDRDGIINKRLIDDYVRTIDEFEILPDFFNIFKLVKFRQYLTIVITNQQGIGKGLMSENDLNNIHNHLQKELLNTCNDALDEFYFCPDLKSSNSKRRKPEPGMLLEAISNWGIEASESWMIGDSISDVVAGKRAGVKTILVGNFEKDNVPEADYIFPNLQETYIFLVKIL